MATTRPEGSGLCITIATASLLLSLKHPAWAQTRVQARLDTEVVATTNGNLSTSGPAHSDTLLTLSPGLSIQSRGPSSDLDGQIQAQAIHSTQGLQQDRMLPLGSLKLHTDLLRQGYGVDAAVSVSQVQAYFISSTAVSETSANRYTNTDWRVSPYLVKALDGETSLQLRMTRALGQSNALDATLASRPDARVTDDAITVARKAAPLGYTLSRTSQSTRVTGQDGPILAREATRGTLRYAVTPELELGLIAGVERISALTNETLDHPRGVLVSWRPSERTRLDGQTEQRQFGRTWKVSMKHRAPWMSFSLNAEREPSSSAFQMGALAAGGTTRDLFDAMLTTRIPDADERSQAVTDLLNQRNIFDQLTTGRDLYSLSAQLSHAVTARAAFMGRRDTLLLQSAMIKSRPLAEASGQPLLPTQDTRQTLQYVSEAQLTHQLTPQRSVTGGLRWTRAREQTPGSAAITSRDVSGRLSISTRLVRDTTATMGLRRTLRHDSTDTSADESALFLGLGHRF
jgi:uncharacterized protein (PEP-CTERM system associated)